MAELSGSESHPMVDEFLSDSYNSCFVLQSSNIIVFALKPPGGEDTRRRPRRCGQLALD